MIEREILTPEKANALLQYQDVLQAEAHNVLTDLHLLDLLATVGPVRPLGSFVHGLMVWRDIDLSVDVICMGRSLLSQLERKEGEYNKTRTLIFDQGARLLTKRQVVCTYGSELRYGLTVLAKL